MSKILEQVQQTVVARRAVYGSPKPNFDDIAALWNAHFADILGPGEANKFTAVDVAHAMILVKMARLKTTPTHEDSMQDVVGYMLCAEDIVAEESGRPRDTIDGIYKQDISAEQTKGDVLVVGCGGKGK